MIRVLAHKILFDGAEHRLSVAEISDDRQQVKVEPFVEETHSTVFVPGTVEIIKTNEGYTYCRK